MGDTGGDWLIMPFNISAGRKRRRDLISFVVYLVQVELYFLWGDVIHWSIGTFCQFNQMRGCLIFFQHFHPHIISPTSIDIHNII